MRTGLSLVVSLLLLLSSSANTFSLYTDMLKALTQQRSDMSTNVMTDFFRPRTYVLFTNNGTPVKRKHDRNDERRRHVYTLFGANLIR
ncbi:hypothetical protein QR680_015750 [Steinernema hermaphroditum]|uniref:Uncharacterized protein n=1 Tax=Steinernema hermaphroditum TaxID=289476 RepID=A0AA39H8V6_9BILA|nr:hypothetical protein QR680_015750 [Steinernema hermaphroditum]